MKRKLQVFISSTYEDMKLERQAAVEAVLRAGHIPAGMELFAAGDESQWETIQRWIDDSDVYMLILGGRYGSIKQTSGKSYIELEYNYATEMKKPLFAAVISEERLASKVRETGPNAMERLNGHLLRFFREETVTKKICRFFGDLNELKLNVFESLSNLDRNENLAGWVRGSEVVDPKATFEEIGRLQGENSQLRQQLEELEAASAISIDGPNDEWLLVHLSFDAKRILMLAQSSNGIILYSPASFMQVGGEHLMNGETRQEARWKAALDELDKYRLIELYNHNHDTFILTHRGYTIADELEGGVSASSPIADSE